MMYRHRPSPVCWMPVAPLRRRWRCVSSRRWAAPP